MTQSRTATYAFGFVFIAILLATPWFIGGNLPWIRTGCLAACCLLGAVFVLYPPMLGAPTKAALLVNGLLMLGVGYGAFQLCPEFEATASFYPAGTRERVCELILGVGVFVIATSLFKHRHLIPWLFGLIAINGALLTFIGIAQRISGSNKVFWVYELINGGEPFGPFVNGNNAGGYLLMCFAALNFFLARRFFRSQKSHSSNPLLAASQRASFKSTFDAAGRAFAGLQLQHMYVFAGIILIATGVVATLSRGATVALAVGVLTGWLFLFKKNLASLSVLIVVMAAGFGILVWTEQSETVTSNLESLTDFESAAERRVEHWGLTLTYAQEDLFFGHGLGTHSLIYPSLQKTSFKRWFKHAENQYLETLAEMGIVGLVFLLSVLVLMFWASLNLLSKPDSNSRAVGVTAIICLSSQAVAAFLDFGLYQPANMWLMATICGVVFAQHNWFWNAQNITRQETTRGRVALAWGSMLIVLVASSWATYEYSAIDARRAGRRFNERFDGTGDVESLKSHQGLLEYALRIRPDDAMAHYELALNHVLQFRMEAAQAMLETAFAELDETTIGEDDPTEPPLEELPEPSSDGLPLGSPGQNKQIASEQSPAAQGFEAGELDELEELRPTSIEEAWERTKVSGVHRLAHMSMRSDQEAYEALVNSPPVNTHLANAWNELNLAETFCDRLWMTQLRLGQLACLMGERENEGRYLAEAVARCPNDASLLFMIGLLEHQAGQTELSAKHWNRCLTLTRAYEEPIIRFCRFEVAMDVVKNQVLPTNPYFRLRIAKKYFGAPEDLLLKKWLLNHTKSTLDQYECSEAELLYLKGEIERAMFNFPIASVYFRKALEKDENRTQWRIGYARSLMGEGYFTEAITELTKCQFYGGDHMLEVERLLRRSRRLRAQQIREKLTPTL